MTDYDREDDDDDDDDDDDGISLASRGLRLQRRYWHRIRLSLAEILMEINTVTHKYSY